MQEFDYSQKQATVTIKEYKKDGSYKLTNQKFTPFSYALGASSTKTVNFFDAANREINKLEFDAKGSKELAQQVSIQGIGNINATEFNGLEKVRLLKDFGLTERVNDDWAVYTNVAGNSKVDVIFADRLGNPKDVYTYSQGEELVNISRYKYVNGSNDSYRVKEYKYAANPIALKEEWNGPTTDTLSYTVDKSGRRI